MDEKLLKELAVYLSEHGMPAAAGAEARAAEEVQTAEEMQAGAKVQTAEEVRPVKKPQAGEVRPVARDLPAAAAKDYLSSSDERNLSDLMAEMGASFHEKLFELIAASGMSDTEVYKRAGMDRKLFSKIRSNPAYHPRKSTILALAIALRLDMEETKDLLSRAEYAFSPGSRADLIVKFFIEHRVYDIDAVNYTLYEYQLPLLI